jgi:uncharacterized protein (DUF433 family)
MPDIALPVATDLTSCYNQSMVAISLDLISKEGSGQAYIAGTAIPVRDIASAHRNGLTAEEICAVLQSLSLAHIHAALAYYYANKAQVDEEITLAESEAGLTSDEDEEWSAAFAATIPDQWERMQSAVEADIASGKTSPLDVSSL